MSHTQKPANLITFSIHALSLSLALSSFSANAQYFDPQNGSSAQSGGFSSTELDYLKSMCMNMYSEFLSIDKQRARSSSSQMSGGVSYSPTSLGGSLSTAESQSSQSRDAKVSSSQGMTSCDGIVGPYFRYKEAQLQAEAMKTVGLANADAMKSVGLANANTNQTVGLANADALKSVGIANSKAQLYTGLAGAGGSVLASLFTSGNQKAAVKAQAEAEVEKAKIIADLELQKARLQHELARSQSGYPNNYQQYQQPNYTAPQHYSQPYAVQGLQQQAPHYPQQAYIQQQAPNYVAQPSFPQQPTPAQQPASFNSGVIQATAASNTSIRQQSSKSSVSVAGIITSLGLVQDPACNPGGIIILMRTGVRLCAFPKATLPPGQYLYDNGRLQKY